MAIISLQVIAQKSDEIRKVGRTKYYVHIVEQGHTLYAISKVYSVDIDEIIAANPDVVDGLSIGEEVLIPVKSVNKKEAKSNPPEIEDGQLVHNVIKGETLYGISKKYKVSVEELVKNNPQLASGLQPGMKLVINQQTIPDLEVKSIKPALPDNYIIHEVKPKETMYGISKMYNVDISDIVKINPNLSEGLKTGMIINIPRLESDTIDQDAIIATLDEPIRKEAYKVALFLPFQLSEVDSAFIKSAATGTAPTFNSYSLASVEFYNGFLIAVDSLKSKGLNLELSVFDVSNDDDANRLLVSPDLKNQDLFIGPFHYSSFKIMADFANKEGIKIVSPIDHPNKLLLTNSNLLECEASDYTQVREIAKYLKSLGYDGNNLMLSNFDYKNKPLCDEFEKQAQSIGLNYSSISVEFSDREFDLIVPKNLANKLDTGRVNRIFVVSSKEGYLSRLFDRMNAIDTSIYKIEVYGLNDWLKIDQINTRYKVKYNTTLALTHFINYNDENLNLFIRRYRALHNTNPSANGFAFKGFDIAYYHLKELMFRGTNFEQYFAMDEKWEGLQSIFNYHQTQATSGYENSGLYFVRYEGYELIRVGDSKYLDSSRASNVEVIPETEILGNDSLLELEDGSGKLEED